MFWCPLGCVDPIQTQHTQASACRHLNSMQTMSTAIVSWGHVGHHRVQDCWILKSVSPGTIFQGHADVSPQWAMKLSDLQSPGTTAESMSLFHRIDMLSSSGHHTHLPLPLRACPCFIGLLCCQSISCQVMAITHTCRYPWEHGPVS